MNNNIITAKLLKTMAECAYLMSLAIAGDDDPEFDVETNRRNAPQAAATPVSKPNIQDDGEMVCSDCGAPITKGILRVSVSKYGKPLCMKCQRGANVA